MDKIILSKNDINLLLQWRDENKSLVRQNVAPFKGIILEFPDTKIQIKAINKARAITFYISINGKRAGKISGIQIPGGLYRVRKNETKLNGNDIQSIITVYSSLMAFIVYHTPAPALEASAPQKGKRKPETPKKQRKPGQTYLFRHMGAELHATQHGHHKSPAGAFTVRGHYRHYKNGKTVWIKPYTKGNGNEKSKTYKL